MDYNILEFVDRLRTRMYYRFPIETNITNLLKHKNRPRHIRDVAFMENGIQVLSDNMVVFEIGNEVAERDYPYYHILEDAPVIRKRGRGTEKTKGSQALVSDMSKRDYAIVNFNGKTFSKEYERNVRGARNSIVNRSTRFVNGVKINQNASSYQNVHYKYIEKMLNVINPLLAEEFNMKLGRTQSSGLAEEFVMDNYAIGDMGYDNVSSWVGQIIGM